jgi:endonuclease YncB( thermonuclease family)
MIEITLSNTTKGKPSLKMRVVEGNRLEFDWQRRDKYNRLLAYVYLLDGTFLNAEIIKQGYGFAYAGFSLSMWRSSDGKKGSVKR